MTISATNTTFQIGTYTASTDTFTLVVDLNDRATWWMSNGGLKMPQPEKVFVRSFNVRTPGELITRRQYKNRHIQYSFFTKAGASTQAIVNSIHTLLSAIENPPYVIRLALPGSTNYSYADVVAVTHNIPYDPQQILAKAQTGFQIDFEAKPGFRGDRITLQNLAPNPGFEAASGTAVAVFNDTFLNNNAYTVQAGSAPAVAANVMTIANGTRVSFGSPAWGAMRRWKIRWQFLTSSSPQFFLHYTDANNQLYVQYVPGSNFWQIIQRVGGTAHTVAQDTGITLTANNWYWAQITQFPVGDTGTNPYISATLSNDSAGSIGSTVSSIQAPTYDAVTALIGAPQILASGANLPVGGNFTTGVHNVKLYGPGAWTYTTTVGASNGVISGGWDINTNDTYPSGPVTSFGAARADYPPAGIAHGTWNLYSGGTPTGTQAIPIATAGDVIAVSCYVKSSGLGNAATTYIVITEYDASGASLRTSSNLAQQTGNIASWTQMSATYTTGASCAFIDVALHTQDSNAGASANGTVWFDNVQVYDQTSTGQTSMPYCELRFPQSPAQLTVSGILGDMPAPTLFSFGTYANWPAGDILNFAIGRRGQLPTKSGRMAHTSIEFPSGYTMTDDDLSYSGYYGSINSSSSASVDMPITNVADMIGTYHVFHRFLSNENTPANLSVLCREYLYVNGTTQAVYIPSAIASPYSYTNYWEVIDVGQLIIPAWPVSSVASTSAITVQPIIIWSDNSSPNYSLGWIGLIPVDGELLFGQWNNPSGASNQTDLWIMGYSDGLGSQTQLPTSWTYSIGNNSLFTPSLSAGGSGTQSSPTVNINPSSSPFMYLDPNQTVAGVNQICGFITIGVVNQSQQVMPLHCEIMYSPLYLWPR